MSPRAAPARHVNNDFAVRRILFLAQHGARARSKGEKTDLAHRGKLTRGFFSQRGEGNVRVPPGAASRDPAGGRSERARSAVTRGVAPGRGGAHPASPKASAASRTERVSGSESRARREGARARRPARRLGRRCRVVARGGGPFRHFRRPRQTFVRPVRGRPSDAARRAAASGVSTRARVSIRTPRARSLPPLPWPSSP